MADRVPQDRLATSLPGERPIALKPEELALQSLPELGLTLDRCLKRAHLRELLGLGEDETDVSPEFRAATLWMRRAARVSSEVGRRDAELREGEGD